MPVEDEHRSPLWILRTTRIPVMAGIPRHNRHIIGIRGNDGEILRIMAFQIFSTEHGQSPSQRITLPDPIYAEHGQSFSEWCRAGAARSIRRTARALMMADSTVMPRHAPTSQSDLKAAAPAMAPMMVVMGDLSSPVSKPIRSISRIIPVPTKTRVADSIWSQPHRLITIPII